MPTLAFFEDEAVNHLKPLVLTRPAFELRAGILSLRHRIELDLSHEADYFLSRPEVAHLVNVAHDDRTLKVLPRERTEATLFINGRLASAPPKIVGEWRSLLDGTGTSLTEARRWMSGDVVVAAWCPPSQIVSVDGGFPDFEAFDSVQIEGAQLVRRLWDLTGSVAAFISDDASAIGSRGVSDDAIVSPEAILTGGHFMAVGQGAIIEAGAVLLSEDGPVIVEPGAHVMAGAIVRGPCHVGRGAHVRMGARIASTSVGEQSRIGGEVSNSVIFGFSNKAHDGYLGNSYVGAWCNLGADTNTSNLRNDYGEISLFNQHLATYEATGQQFVGLIMGDHSRSGINTMFNTGTVVGVACSVFGPGYQPRHIPSFSWGGKPRLVTYRPERAFESARAMMARRGKTLSQEEEAALTAVFENERPH